MKKWKLRQRVAELEDRVSELETEQGTVTLRVHMREGSFIEKTIPFKGWGYGKNHTFVFPCFTHSSFTIDEMTWHVKADHNISGSYGSCCYNRYIDKSGTLTIDRADYLLNEF